MRLQFDGQSELVRGKRWFSSMSVQIQQVIGESATLTQAAFRGSNSRIVSGRVWQMLLIVWVLTVAYAAFELKRGWIPHDDGAFAQSAERVLNGELPHRDFDDTYTGGLAFADALAFHAFGVNLASLRFVLFGFFVVWIPVVYYVASRFAGAYASAGLTLLAAAWSIPNYSAAVPSWYNLFFAIFGTAALLRYIDTGTRRWLFVAGICAGLSIVVKIIGLYFVAAAILFFAYREQFPHSNPSSGFRTLNRIYRAAIVVGTVAIAFILANMIVRNPGSHGLVYFLLPPCALMTVLVSRELSSDRVRTDCRFTAFFKMLVPFAAGTMIPVVIFLIPYMRSGAVRALVHGVFILPAKRFESATMGPPNLNMMETLIPISLLLCLAYCCGKKGRIIGGVVLGIYLGIVLHFSANTVWAYRAGWFSIATAIPLVTAVAAIYLGVPRFSRILDSDRQQRLMLLFSVLAMTSLVQFPFSAPIYFCYAAPVLILAAAGLFGFIPGTPRIALGALMIFYLLFVIWRITPSFVNDMGYAASSDFQTEELSLPRGGQLRISPIEAQMYEELIPLIRQHTVGDFTYAGPDCAEIYFLAGLKNPTRTLFDSFDDPAGRTLRIQKAIEAHHITVLTFNERPGFAGKINQDLEQLVKTDFPYSRQVGNFRVRWRE